MKSNVGQDDPMQTILMVIFVCLFVCLIQTTLFQTKLLDATNPSSIYINTTCHSLNTDLTKAPSFFGSGSVAAVLRDVNGKNKIGIIKNILDNIDLFRVK